jgi:hypothetical protein
VNRARGEIPNNEPLRGREDAQGDIELDTDQEDQNGTENQIRNKLNEPSSSKQSQNRAGNCDKTNRESSKQINHSHSHNEKDKKNQRQQPRLKSYPYICPTCLICFKHTAEVKDHDAKEHGKIRKWVCGLCPQKVYHKDRKISLTRHWERNHKDFPGYFIPKK